MAKLVVMYRKPADPAAFDDYYFEHHVPLAKTIPGLERYDVSDGPVSSVDGASPYHLIAMLEFESMNALQQGMASSEGRAAGKDAATFGRAGMDMLIFETREV